ncbi:MULTISPECIES: hypothetical protein [unclassified Fusibacter]|uniref:hypothetical protein n=1 Tax=unclassified Fusibacter TaxID=2624464 RepID=UPI0010109B18|nr:MULTISPECIES: hypothetical protein [unclassified Fusibacter]MCK8059302.1 hypothetical protein [Fusibacter sp. A2]NPE21234.1 hypothetical protein [Fusibacter sp. A1]RXV62501.1 hypothetical protein DWB64_05310 [Fusibacter sp. A1]
MTKEQVRQRLEQDIRSVLKDDSIHVNLRRGTPPFDYAFHSFFIRDKDSMLLLRAALDSMDLFESYELTTTGFVNLTLTQSARTEGLTLGYHEKNETYLRMKRLSHRMTVEGLGISDEFTDEKFIHLVGELKAAGEIEEQYAMIQNALDQVSMRGVSEDEKKQWKRLFYFFTKHAEN